MIPLKYSKVGVVVMGGFRGIGAATARSLLLKYGVGHVAITGRNAADGEIAAKNLMYCIDRDATAGAAEYTVSTHVLDLSACTSHEGSPVHSVGARQSSSYADDIATRSDEVLNQVQEALRLHPSQPHMCSLALVAGASQDGLLVRYRPDALEEQMRVNMLGPMIFARQFARRAWLRPPPSSWAGDSASEQQTSSEQLPPPPQSARSLLAIGSVAGARGNPGQCGYAAAKAGLGGFVRSFAAEMGPRGVRANVLEPGLVRTRMTAGGPDGVTSEDSPLLRAGAAASPLGRVAEADEVGGLAAFMLVAEEAAFVTGATWTADGGVGLGLGSAGSDSEGGGRQ